MADHARALLEDHAHPDPFAQFAAWFAQAAQAGVPMPEAMALATATTDGAPSVRMVLLKGYDRRGFRFFSGYQSRKGIELAANPRAALMFYWHMLGRQVRVEGVVSRLAGEESAAYVRTRPRASRISALASPQSRPIPSRAWLEQQVAELERELGDAEPPLPSDWGGYILAPESFEFWQHRDDRLHDRLRYLPGADGRWRIERLAP
jgi:pyridoxamine 5'-phosphate oxidase